MYLAAYSLRANERYKLQHIMALFHVGDSVIWVKAVADNQPAMIGTVVAVMPSDSEVDEFALYDVEFDFGTFTLHGTQLKAQSQRFSA